MTGPFGTLFVIATPIGNLEDITLRALRVLREVALVAAEDTRRTANLLRHYNIQTRLVSLHEHNERARVRELVGRLTSGESVALVSDAGTPGISDPGADFVHAARQAGVRVEPIPGPSAVTAMLSASGLPAERFVFAGFPPVRSKDRRAWFEWVGKLHDVPVVCFEAPHRIKTTLADLQRNLVSRPIILARELTKLHEEWIFLDPNELSDENVQERGEFALILVPGPACAPAVARPSDTDIWDVFGQITEHGTSSRREAVKQTARRLGLSSRTVYAALERRKAPPEP
jgi:16S rRNA (cytidine1402-2'-O)-methyltransferase